MPAFPDARVIATWEARLGDLQARGARLSVACIHCGREAPASVEALVRAHGADQRLARLEKRLRCDGCRQRGGGYFKVEWPETAP